MSNDGKNIYDKAFDEREDSDRSDELITTVFLNLLKFIGGLIVLPAVLYGTIFYYLILRKFKQKMWMTSIIATLSWLVLFGVWSIDSVGNTFINGIKNITEISSNWENMIPGFIVIQLALGTLIGFVVIGLTIYQMKANPHRLKIAGNWMYKFTFNRSPFDLIFRKSRIKALKAGTLTDKEKSPLGLDENDKRDGIVYRYLEESVQHTIITGAAGSGKTVTELSLMLSDIKIGRSFAVVDFKKSPEFAAKLSAWCKEYGRNFYHFVNGKPENYDVKDSLGQCTYDPLAGSSPTARADMILGMRVYDQASEVYKQYMTQLLQVLFNAIDKADRKKYKESYRETVLDSKEKSSVSNKVPRIIWNQGGIHQLASVISSKITLDGLADACIGTDIEDDIREIAENYGMKTQLGNVLSELKGQMRTITASEYGAWLKTGDKDARSIDLSKLMSSDGNVVLFSINSDTEPEFAKNVGTLIFSDLNSVSTNLRESGNTEVRSIYVDEFQAVHPSTVKSLLEKARESRLAVILAQQSLDQIVSTVGVGGENYLNAILEVCSNFIVHAGSTESSAERLSRIIGKEWVTKYSQSNSNESFIFSFNFWNKRKQIVQTSEVELPIAPTRLFMDLSMPNAANGFKSTAVFVNKNSLDPIYKNQKGGKAREIWIIPDDRVIAKYFTPKMSNGSSRIITEDEEIFRTDEEIPEISKDSTIKETSENSASSQISRNSKKISKQQSNRAVKNEENIDDELLPVDDEESEDFIFEEIPEDEIDADMGMELFSQEPPEKTEDDELVERLIAEREAKRAKAKLAASRNVKKENKGSSANISESSRNSNSSRNSSNSKKTSSNSSGRRGLGARRDS